MASTGFSLGVNGFIWVNEFRGILERFSGYVFNGLSVNGCIVSASSALWVGFWCFLGLKVSDKEKCSYRWHDFIYYVYKKKSLKNFLVECLEIRKTFLPLLSETIRKHNKTLSNMKTKTFGDSFFMVAIYYTDEAGCMHCFNERWSRKECAQNAKEFYERRVGKWFDGIEFSGKIDAVFTYKCKHCTIA